MLSKLGLGDQHALEPSLLARASFAGAWRQLFNHGAGVQTVSARKSFSMLAHPNSAVCH